jgi:hypothetical protein
MTLLPEVETTLQNAVRRHHRLPASRTGQSWLGGEAGRRSRVSPPKLGLAAASLVAVALAAVVVGLLVTTNETSRSPILGTTAQIAPAALSAEFVSLRTARTTSDNLPSDVVSALAHEHIRGIDVSTSRLLLTTATHTAWLVPGPQETCVILRRGLRGPSATGVISSACSPDSVVEQSGIVSVSGTTIVGVLPDGTGPVTVTLRDGSTLQLTANDRGGFARDLAQPPSKLSYTGANGAAHEISVPSPTPAPGGP